MATVISSNKSGSISHTSAIRAVAIECGDALDYELTYKEIIRFLPTSVVAEFIEHLETVADINDITAELKEYK